MHSYVWLITKYIIHSPIMLINAQSISTDYIPIDFLCTVFYGNVV